VVVVVGTMPVPQGFGRPGQHQRDVGLAEQRRGGVRGDADQRDLEAAGVGDDVGEFGRFA